MSVVSVPTPELRESSVPAASIHPDRRRWDRQLWLALLVAAIVLIPRGLLITHVQSERVDDQYHIVRGIKYLTRTLTGRGALALNDPPLGEGISAIPNLLTGCMPANPRTVNTGLRGYRVSADTLLNLIGVWKTLLFLPMVGVVFAWVRGVYNAAAAWLALALLLVEPTIAAHIPLPTLDVIGTEGIVIACFLAWRYARQPTWGRLTAAAAAAGVALMLKHTAIILPGVALVMAGLWWILRPWREGTLRGTWETDGRRWIAQLAAAVAIVPLTIWALTFFNVSKPALPDEWEPDHPKLAKLLDHKFPAGVYISSVLEASAHSKAGHWGYLLGRVRKTGWWFYFPIVATYKVPLGIVLVLLVGAISLIVVRPRWEEWGLLIPAIAWAAFMMTSTINIGWRHFLPAYVFFMLLACRVMLANGLAWRGVAWAGVVIAGVHVLLWTPDWISYINFPRRHPAYLDISDSNIDWGQGLKQVRQWIESHPEYRDRKISYRDMGWGENRMPDLIARLSDLGVQIIDRNQVERMPQRGLLIVSPVALAGVYEKQEMYRGLRNERPIDVIGHCTLVFDLDELAKGGRFKWPAPKRPQLLLEPPKVKREYGPAPKKKRASTTTPATSSSGDESSER